MTVWVYVVHSFKKSRRRVLVVNWISLVACFMNDILVNCYKAVQVLLLNVTNFLSVTAEGGLLVLVTCE